MKKIYVWTLSILTLSACNMDDNENTATPIPANAGRITTGYPEHLLNSRDDSGYIHFQLTDGYLTSGHVTSSLTDAIVQAEMLAAGNASFQQLRPMGYAAPTATRLAYILEDKPGRIAEVIDQGILSWRAKVSLANFISSLQWYKEQKSEYAVIYQFIINYENSILADPLFSAEDSRILLTTSSIARYAFYFAKKEKEKEPRRRDRDWDISMGNIAAGADGANESTAKAVSMATAAALYVNR